MKSVQRLLPVLALLFFGLQVQAEPATAQISALRIREGKATNQDFRQLLARDNHEIILKSVHTIGQQEAECILVFPRPAGEFPSPAARIVVALHGDLPVEIKSAVFLPKSRLWEQLRSEYVPTKKGGTCQFDIPRLDRVLLGEEIELRLRFANDEAFTINMDAAVLQIVATQNEPDLHEKAAKAPGIWAPKTQSHVFGGVSSGNYDKKVDGVRGNFTTKGMVLKSKKPQGPKKNNNKKKRKKK